MMSAVTLLVSLAVAFAIMNSQVGQADAIRYYNPRQCKPTCSSRSLLQARAPTENEIKSALEAAPSIQQKIKELEAKGRSSSAKSNLPSYNGFSSKCPCSSCQAQSQRLFSCGRCRIIWPRYGLANTYCRSLNKSCTLGCGCRGQCLPYGPRTQTVVLYCPHILRPHPFQIKDVTTCGNCCCQQPFYWHNG